MSPPAEGLLRVVLWQVDEDGRAREVVSPVITNPALFDLGEAYYAPPAGEEATWPRGRYVFEVKSSTGADSGWVGIEFLAIDDEGAAALR
ncbi:MAG TPA: hypothetical protein VMZ33_02815 [Candidatus Limnocylindrales bacterium]|nr:hypothetical protein [Candidatus Limnocylindrales bacterium]